MRSSIGSFGVLALAIGLCGPTSVRAQDPQPPTTIVSISGRVVDVADGRPVLPVLAPRATLTRCNAAGTCSGIIATMPTDELGNFRFESTDAFPIEAGEFRVSASASRRLPSVLRVTVGPGESVDVGAIALPLVPIEFIVGRICTIPTEGGRCEYSFGLLNNLGREVTATAFSVVNVRPDRFSGTRFEASTRPGDPDVQRATLVLPTDAIQRASFFFDVPASVPDGTQFCPGFAVGVDPTPLLNTANAVGSFCATKGEVDAPLPQPPAPPVAFENLQPCPTVPLTGGSCEYTVDLVNTAATPFAGTARSSVDGAFGSFGRLTYFEVDEQARVAEVTRPRVRLPAFGRTTLRFAFEVPAAQSQGRYGPLCTRLYLSDAQAPIFAPLRQEMLFCLIKSDAGFEARVPVALPVDGEPGR